MQADVVERPDPFQGREFDFVDGTPWLASFDQLSLEQPVDRFSQSFVVGVTDGAGGCFGFPSPRGVRNIAALDIDCRGRREGLLWV